MVKGKRERVEERDARGHVHKFFFFQSPLPVDWYHCLSSPPQLASAVVPSPPPYAGADAVSVWPHQHAHE